MLTLETGFNKEWAEEVNWYLGGFGTPRSFCLGTLPWEDHSLVNPKAMETWGLWDRHIWRERNVSIGSLSSSCSQPQPGRTLREAFIWENPTGPFLHRPSYNGDEPSRSDILEFLTHKKQHKIVFTELGITHKGGKQGRVVVCSFSRT